MIYPVCKMPAFIQVLRISEVWQTLVDRENAVGAAHILGRSRVTERNPMDSRFCLSYSAFGFPLLLSCPGQYLVRSCRVTKRTSSLSARR